MPGDVSTEDLVMRGDMTVGELRRLWALGYALRRHETVKLGREPGDAAEIISDAKEFEAYLKDE